MEKLQEISVRLREGNAPRVKELTAELLKEGIPAQTIMRDGLISGMEKIGYEMSTGEIFLPEVLQSARAMNASMELLRPLLQLVGIKAVGTIVLGTVKGDMHDIGKKIVSIMMQGAGLDVVDLGVDVPPEKFVDAIKTHQPQLVGLSALLTTTMGAMKKTIEAIESAGIRNRVRILIGGAPTTQRFAEEIGADGYAPDAGAAVVKAKELLISSFSKEIVS
jgi:5-methyltetrahydrofolate--homocysteine methyltransferase